MSAKCWTCMSDHPADAPCAGLDPGPPDRTSDFFDNAEDAATSIGTKFGPIFMATFPGTCSACDDLIYQGEDIRADGSGGWIHADDGCERMAR